MIKKLRKKFVLVAMLSMLGVTLLLVIATNVVNYIITTKELDATLVMLSQNRGAFVPPEVEPQEEPPVKPEGDFEFSRRVFDKESLYGVRFYIVSFDEAGEVTNVDVDKIASVSGDEAIENAKSALDRGKTAAFEGEFRYYVTADRSSVVFMYCGEKLDYMGTVALISFGVLVFICLIMFLLLTLLSKRIVKPVMENIERQRQFITDASHELMTPLTIISANADMVDITYGKNEWNDSSRAQISRLKRLVNDLVRLSQADELEQTRQSFEELNMSDAVLEAAYAFTAVAAAADKTLTLDVPPDIIIKGDENGLRQLVSVLTDNAVKYANAGGHIDVSLRKRKKGAVLKVKNTCDNVERLEPQRLFDRFYRSDHSRSRETGGFGIGLSIASAVVEAHNGRIEATTEDGKSVTMTVTL